MSTEDNVLNEKNKVMELGSVTLLLDFIGKDGCETLESESLRFCGDKIFDQIESVVGNPPGFLSRDTISDDNVYIGFCHKTTLSFYVNQDTESVHVSVHVTDNFDSKKVCEMIEKELKILRYRMVKKTVWGRVTG